MSQIQQNAAWDSRGYEHARRCALVHAYAHAGIHGHQPRAAVAVMSRPSWSPWPTSQPSFHWPCLSALVAAAVCVCVCVCMKYTNSSAQRCNARTHTSSMHCTLKSVCNTASPPALRPPPALVLALAPPRSSFCAAHTSLLLIHPHIWGVCPCVL